MMNSLSLSKTASMFVLLIATAFFATCPAWAQTQEIQEAVSDRVLLARLIDTADETLGATLQPVGDVLRAQLEIPAGQGLLVASLRADSPSALAGLKQNDILLSLADKPLAAADDLTKQLKAAGESPVYLKILRAGKPITIQVRPVYRVTLGPVEEKKTEYFIGVTIESVDDALRAQLALPADRGVVITDVVAGSPAEKAGIKKHDIVLELGDKPIDTPEALSQQVQARQDKPTTLKLLHAGKLVTISIVAATRKVESNLPQEAFRYLALTEQLNRLDEAQLNALKVRTVLNLADEESNLRVRFSTRAGIEDVRKRLDLLEKELKSLHEAVEKVNETLKAGKGQKRE